MLKPVFFSSLLVSTSLLVGCGASNAAPSKPLNTQNVGYYTKTTDSQSSHDSVSDPRPFGTNQDVQDNVNLQNSGFAWDTPTARRIASRVSRIKGVQDSSVLMNNDTVIVGVYVDPRVTDLPTVEQQVRGYAKGLARDKHIRVITNKSIVKQMSQVYTNMDNGTVNEQQMNKDVNRILDQIGLSNTND